MIILSKRLFILQLFLLTSLLGLTKNSSATETLLVGAIPDQNPERLNRLYKLLSSELSDKLNVPVKYVPVTNYSAAVSAFRTRDLDLVWFGALTGIQARIQRPGAKVLAQREIDSKFTSVFIANLKSGIPILKQEADLIQLKRKRFTFGSESSTSGRLMPQYFLQKAGLKISDFKDRRPGFSGSHDATIALVQSGSYEAGVLNKQVWISHVKREKVAKSKIRVIWETPAYANYHWLAQPDLDKKFRRGFTEELKMVLLELNKASPTQSKILELFGANSFIPANVADYRDIEDIGRQLGKIK